MCRRLGSSTGLPASGRVTELRCTSVSHHASSRSTPSMAGTRRRPACAVTLRDTGQLEEVRFIAIEHLEFDL
ncbi:hypothetical protein ABT275_38105 [Streptomyces sp. NPDC001185]|uniref:hypothetical protein n=1 Tax=Streptomyces sp. NPDC001185 TaxID=3154380 RepID=UPI00332B6441